jgi:hypothetical protein
MIDLAIKRLLGVAVLSAAAGLYGCASSTADQDAAMTTACQAENRQECEARDNARQVRGAADYQNEPALGYLQSPPGLLPVPLTSRNSSSN